MERNIWLITDDPAIMRYRRDVKELACSQLVDASVVEGGRRRAGQDKANVLHMASRGADTRADVLTPLPTRLVGRAPNGHATDVHQLETSLLGHANFIRRFEPLEDNVDLVATHGEDNSNENGTDWQAVT